jgi:hypothetical protein
MAHGIDFDKMLSAIDFLFVRAGFAGSSGGAWEDQRIHEYMADLGPKLRADPKPFTLYWYFRDDVSVMEQAVLFSRLVNAYKEVVNLPLIVDAEVFVKGDATSTSKLVDFQTEVERMTGLKVDILYGRAYQLNRETVPGLQLVYPEIFIARYFTKGTYDPQVDDPYEKEGDLFDPRDWEGWTFWQHSETGDQTAYGIGPYGAKGIDEVVYNGTQEELLAYAQLTTPPPHQPPPPDDYPPEELDFSMKIASARTSGEEVALVTFYPLPDCITPQILSLAFGKGRVQAVNVFFVIQGTSFKVQGYSTKYRDYIFMDFPRVWLEEDDYVLVEYVAVDGQTLNATSKIAWS